MFDTSPSPSAAPQRGYTLALLTLMSALAFMDRQILSVLIEPVKLEFGLSDLQIGLVTGLGFALTFGALGVPLGRLADRRERRSLIAWCRGIGGLLGALGATSVGFWSLLISRSGGALSDAGGTPASMSMVADLYPLGQRARAMSVIGAGSSLGALMALGLGSWLAQQHGWRVTMVVAGSISVVLALLLRNTVREPVRAAVVPSTAAHHSPPRGAVRAIWAEPVARWLITGAALTLLAAYSFGAWNIALMVRHHGLSLQHAGWISGAAALTSMAGGLMSGALADRLTVRNLRWQVGVPVLGVALAFLCGLAYLLLPAKALLAAILTMLAFSFFLPWWVAPTYAALSTVVPSQRRATANAMMLMAGAVLGSGLGPILTGWLSDVLNTNLGGDGLRYALMGMVGMLLPGTLAFVQASKAYPAAHRKSLNTVVRS